MAMGASLLNQYQFLKPYQKCATSKSASEWQSSTACLRCALLNQQPARPKGSIWDSRTSLQLGCCRRTFLRFSDRNERSFPRDRTERPSRNGYLCRLRELRRFPPRGLGRLSFRDRFERLSSGKCCERPFDSCIVRRRARPSSSSPRFLVRERRIQESPSNPG